MNPEKESSNNKKFQEYEPSLPSNVEEKQL
jgi:hypothetical protein